MVMRCHCCYYFLLLCSVSIAFPLSSKKRETRYFTQELELPPLQPMAKGTTAKDDDIYTKSLPLLYTNDPKMVSRWLGEHIISSHEGCILGFDVESVPTIPHILKQTTFRGPATVQLSTINSSVVIQLARKNGKPSTACAPLLAAVLQDDSIVKVGCGIDQDLVQLSTQWHTLEARSRLDLSDVFDSKGGNTLGLKTLAQYALGIDLPKSRSLAISNWSCLPLTDRQLQYAARDAWAGAAIVHALDRRYSDTFSPSYLRQSLREQTPLRILQNKLQRRRHAKTLIQTILSPYQGNRAIVPDWKRTLVRQLRQVAKENLLDQMEPILDAADIGITSPMIR